MDIYYFSVESVQKLLKKTFYSNIFLTFDG